MLKKVTTGRFATTRRYKRTYCLLKREIFGSYVHNGSGDAGEFPSSSLVGKVNESGNTWKRDLRWLAVA